MLTPDLYLEAANALVRTDLQVALCADGQWRYRAAALAGHSVPRNATDRALD